MATSTFVMGIDGGGSTVRTVIVTPDMRVLGRGHGSTANPSVIGPEPAAQAIQAAMRQALQAADLTPDQITAVGIGVAGAASGHFHPWLLEVVKLVLPGAAVVLSTDYEIALVGALGKAEGVLMLSGTGSLAYGINAAGDSFLVGGWGYLLGDEGSGYWLGMAGLRAVTYALDGRGPQTSLTAVLFEHLQLTDIRDLVPWLYDASRPPTRVVAELARLVLAEASAEDAVAQRIVSHAADALLQAAKAVTQRLNIPVPPVAFAGGLLTTENLLSQTVCNFLELDNLPVPRYEPVCGAALLALLQLNLTD